MRRHRVFQVVSAIVTLAGLGAAAWLCGRILQNENAELRRTSEAEARQIALRLQAGLLASFEPLQGLAGWWLSQGRPEANEDWRSDAQLFLSKATGLRQAFWVGRDGYQQWMAMPGARPKVVRIRPDARVRQLVEAARVRQAVAASEVFDSPNAGGALYVCFPVYSALRLRGFIVGLYDATDLLAALARQEVRPDHRITVSSGGRRVYSTLTSGRARIRTASANFDLAQQVWNVDLGVPLNYLTGFRGSILAVAGVVSALIYSFSTLLYLSQRHSLALYRAYGELRDLNRDLRRKIVDFQTLLDVSPVGIAVADDPECRQIRANPALARILGVPPNANISQSNPGAPQPTWRMVRNGRDLRPEELPMQVAAATGKEVLGAEDVIVRADGIRIDVLSFAAPLFDEHGKVRGVLDACVDISDRKAQERTRRELEQDLQRAQKLKSLGVMAAGIAHDFNNLLTGIIGRTSLAADSLLPDSEAYKHLAVALQSADQAARLIGQVLAYTGRAYQELRPTHLGQLITALYPELKALAEDRAEIRLAIAANLPEVTAAPEEVRQTLRNLVLNAVEATGAQHNTIEIGVDICELSGMERNLALAGERVAAGSYLRVKVTDRGSGMTPEIAERAFDPFFSTKFLGRGLGLAEVLGIMRAHKGAVQLDTAPDRGTSVTLLFQANRRSATRAA